MVTLDLADTLVIGDGDGLTVEERVRPVRRAGPVAGRRHRRRTRQPGGPGPGSRRAHRPVRSGQEDPPGAGLGGGSADAAAILRWAGCADLALAAGLGADVPFCLVGGRALVRGIGEDVTPLPFEDRRFTLFLLPFGVDTGAVYGPGTDCTARGESDRSDGAAGPGRQRPGGGGRGRRAASGRLAGPPGPA